MSEFKYLEQIFVSIHGSTGGGSVRYIVIHKASQQQLSISANKLVHESYMEAKEFIIFANHIIAASCADTEAQCRDAVQMVAPFLTENAGSSSTNTNIRVPFYMATDKCAWFGLILLEHNNFSELLPCRDQYSFDTWLPVADF
jgi:hypothetical protein